MEESIERKDIDGATMLTQIHRTFGGGTVDIRTYSPLTLAYIGDAVFEMIIRTLIVEKGQRAANTLHKHTTKVVCAQTQAKMIDAVYGYLTEEEQDIYRRGKNTKLHSTAKNASLADYRKATGFEALCGYLFLRDDIVRITQLVKQALEMAHIEL
ncbi:MAG: ribonuclease III [Lachnospiraceae bacterium]|nr:ribonuclease III [Lachnospiraceae bacterium]MDE7204338.1 ribonuclease III [Lachnospiraceae bacterium]